MPLKRSWVLPRMSSGRPAISGLKRSNRRSSSGKTLYFDASSTKSICSSASFSGISLARSCACDQSSGAVELPAIGVSGGHLRRQPRESSAGSRPSSLRDRCRGCRTSRSTERYAGRGLRIIEGIGEAGAFHRRLLHALDDGRLGKPGQLQNGRRNIDHMMELVANLALAVDALGQCTIMPLRVPPQCEATCLVHW